MNVRKNFFAKIIVYGVAVVFLSAVLFTGCDPLEGSIDEVLEKAQGGGGTQATYTVTFHINGGTGTVPDAITRNAGTSITLPGGSGFSKIGSELLGWCADDLGGGIIYGPETSFVSEENITLFAIWNVVFYIVTFNSNGGNPVDPQHIAPGLLATKPSPDPTRDGYTFDRWCSDSILTTGYNFFTPVNSDITIYANWNVDPLTSVVDVNNYLAVQTGGDNNENPVRLPVAFDLGNMTSPSNGWKNLLTAINTAGKYVALDLSGCTMSGTVFNPDYTFSTGKNLIVSIVLPDVAESTADGEFEQFTFKDFIYLKTAKGAKILTIGKYAFGYSCYNLVSVEFPKATTIGEVAFAYCQKLTSVNMEAVTTIGTVAFDYCTGLTNAYFPNAEIIYPRAFLDCENLARATFQASAEFIFDENPFYGCISLTSFELVGTGNLTVDYGSLLIRNGNELVAYPSAGPTGTHILTSPSITKIGAYAMAHARLADLEATYVTEIGDGAFEGSENLSRVKFSKLIELGNIFRGCINLSQVELPAVTSIGYNAFSGIYSDTPITISLGATAPSLYYGIMQYTDPKTVTIKVPGGASGYGTVPAAYSGSGSTPNWGDGFRGYGWNGSAFTTSNEYFFNSGITLNIEYAE